MSNNVYCNVCGEEYNAAAHTHVCDANALEIIFMQEIEQPEHCNLNGTALLGLKQAIKDNGSPDRLVAMWKKSADGAQKWQA